MISSNSLCTFILHHDLNGLCDKNIRLIQYLMRTIKPANEKFKCMCEDFPNMAILTKSATPGKVQLTFAHVSVGNNYLGGSVTAFTLAVSVEALSVIYINSNIDFANTGRNIQIPITKVLFCAAGHLYRLKKQRY